MQTGRLPERAGVGTAPESLTSLVNQRGHHTPSGASRFRTVAAAVSFACGDVHQRGYRYRSGIFR